MNETPSTDEDWLEEREINIEEEEEILGEDEPSHEIDPGKPTQRKGSTRKPAAVWVHFTKVIPFNPKDPKCICNYCQSSFKCDSKANGTSHLNYHITKACKSIPRETDNKQKTLALQINSECGESTTNLITWKFNKEECRKALARMLIIDELPFSFVEGEGFLEFCRKICPSFVVPSRRTICRDVLDLFAEAKDHLKKMFSNCLHGVSLTTDTWTSCQNINYMVLTAHFIDSNWKLHKRILNFCVINSHKGEQIGKLIVACIKEWDLKRIVSITVDNASANDVAINYVRKVLNESNGCVLDGEFLHIRCCAHILNLIVNDGLKEIHNTILGIRTAVRYVRSSPSRLNKFRELAIHLEIGHKSMLALDVPTRWNSTYSMLESALKYHKVFDDMIENDGLYVAHFTDALGVGAPSFHDWKNAEIFVKFLKYFYDATLKFSSSLSISSNVCFPELSMIQEEMEELIKNLDPTLSRMAKNMKTKFDKYWGNVGSLNKVLLLTCVLDPRYKLEYLTISFDDIYDRQVAETKLAEVKDTLVRFFDFYCTDSTFGMQTCDEPQPYTSVASGSSDNSVHFRRMNALKQRAKEQDSGSNELEKYLNAPIEEAIDGFDVLLWWKVNSNKYRVLSLLARDLLAIPVSTVASESAFSTGGRVIDSFRSSLTPKMIEALVTSQNWLRSKPISIDHRVEVPLDDVNYYDTAFSDFSRGRGGPGSSLTVEPNL